MSVPLCWLLLSFRRINLHPTNKTNKTFFKEFLSLSLISIVYIFNIQFFIFCIKYLCGTRAPVPLFWRVSPVLSSRFVREKEKKKLLPSPERGLIMKGEKTKKFKKKSRQKLIKHGKTRGGGGGGEEDFRGFVLANPRDPFLLGDSRTQPTRTYEWREMALCVYHHDRDGHMGIEGKSSSSLLFTEILLLSLADAVWLCVPVHRLNTFVSVGRGTQQSRKKRKEEESLAEKKNRRNDRPFLYTTTHLLMVEFDKCSRKSHVRVCVWVALHLLILNVKMAKCIEFRFSFLSCRSIYIRFHVSVCVFFLSTEREKLKIKGEREREIKYSTSLKKRRRRRETMRNAPWINNTKEKNGEATECTRIKKKETTQHTHRKKKNYCVILWWWWTSINFFPPFIVAVVLSTIARTYQ